MEQLVEFLQGLPLWTPQAIYASLIVVGLGKDLAKDGEVQIQGENPIKSMSATIFTVSILIWGKFFSEFGFPQAIYTFLLLLGVGIIFSGKKTEQKVTFWSSFFVRTCLVGVLAWGGFFNF